eukprot:Gb_33580 [translate_table: standard]
MVSRSRGYSTSPSPYQMLFILLIVILFLALPWYMSYESALESSTEELELLVMVLPLIILLAIRCLSGMERPPTFWFPRSSQRYGNNRAESSGSSPWGVALMLVLLWVMISYQSVFHDQWFPLWTRS